MLRIYPCILEINERIINKTIIFEDIEFVNNRLFYILDTHLRILTEILSVYGTKYVNTIPQFYYVIKLTESGEGRKMLIKTPYLRQTVSRMLDRINNTPELVDLLDDDLNKRFIELMTYWRENGDRPIFSADDLYGKL